MLLVKIYEYLLCSHLDCAARAHTNDMVDRNFLGHTGSDGSNVQDRVLRCGYTQPIITGENVAAGNPNVPETLDALMQSPGHRANILDPRFTMLGFFYRFESDIRYRHYWTQVFSNSNRESCSE